MSALLARKQLGNECQCVQVFTQYFCLVANTTPPENLLIAPASASMHCLRSMAEVRLQ